MDCMLILPYIKSLEMLDALELNLVCSGATTLSLAQASLPTVTPLLVMQQLFAKVRAGMSRGSEGWGRGVTDG